ncbi:hypothetical protein DL96DRAFT_1610717 [Flagelloscypha sp. PMI_526]|nr:hypothetical protein DL96DRAFT_1610717 [Flagelloscypha sp. PMI_526]
MDQLAVELVLRISTYVASQDDGSSIRAWAQTSNHFHAILCHAVYSTVAIYVDFKTLPQLKSLVQTLETRLPEQRPRHLYLHIIDRDPPLTQYESRQLNSEGISPLIDICAPTLESFTFISTVQRSVELSSINSFPKLRSLAYSGLDPYREVLQMAKQQNFAILQPLAVIQSIANHSVEWQPKSRDAVRLSERLVWYIVSKDSSATIPSLSISLALKNPESYRQTQVICELFGDDVDFRQLQETMKSIQNERATKPGILNQGVDLVQVDSGILPDYDEMRRKWVMGISFDIIDRDDAGSKTTQPGDSS